MLELIITEEADNDLFEIAEYTEAEWDYRQRKYYITALYERMEWLIENYKLAKSRDDIKRGYFSYPQGKHHIFFQIADNRLFVIGVLHETRDFSQHLP